MEKNKQQLQHNYDSAFLALLMDEYAEQLGEKVLREYEQTEASSDADDSLDAACEEIIRSSKTVRENGHRIKKILGKVGVVAAVIAILFALLIGAQAVGVDVFGTLARWTGEVFKFRVDDEAAYSEPQADRENDMQKMLESLDMPVELAPTWIPEGYALVNIKEVNTDACFGAYAVFKSGNHHINIEITEYCTATDLNCLEMQMDDITPEEYMSRGKTFYLFTNTDYWRGAWSEGRFVISLSGFPSKEMMLRVIDSIGEVSYE